MRHVESRKSQVSTHLLRMEENASQESHPSGNVYQEVTVTHGQRLRTTPEPDEEHGREGHQFPEQEQRKKVSGIDGAERSANIRPGGDVLSVFLDMEPIQCPNNTHESHDVA